MASRGINKVILVGNLGQDPEVRYTPSGKPVVSLSVATSESWTDKNEGVKESTEWHKVVVFGQLAVLLDTQLALSKGAQIYVEGKNKTRKWRDKSGVDRYTTEIVVDGFSGVLQALGRRTEADKPAQQQATATAPGDNGFDNSFDDDCPF